jgi:hypothetical protein
MQMDYIRLSRVILRIAAHVRLARLSGTDQRGWLNLRLLMATLTRVPTESQREQRHEETLPHSGVSKIAGLSATPQDERN